MHEIKTMLPQPIQRLLDWFGLLPTRYDPPQHKYEHVDTSFTVTSTTPTTMSASIPSPRDEPVQEPCMAEFELHISPRRGHFKQDFDLTTITIEDFLQEIYLRYPECEVSEAVLYFLANGDRFTPKTDKLLREVLRRLADKDIRRITVIIGTPTMAFSKYTLQKVAHLYNLPEFQSFDSLSSFFCGQKTISNNNKAKRALEGLFWQLDAWLASIPHFSANEAAKSVYTVTFLGIAATLYQKKIRISPQHNIKGEHGHGNVDFAIISTVTNLIAGVTEVKKDDFSKGIAQNMVQMEAALFGRKGKRKFEDEKDMVFGIVTDSATWYFLSCTMEEGADTPTFQLSRPSGIVYEGNDYEKQVKEVFCRILWLFD